MEPILTATLAIALVVICVVVAVTAKDDAAWCREMNRKNEREE